MPSGTVKWFNDAKGFGFIQPDGGGADAFAHFTAIEMTGFKTLHEGQRVDFELTQGAKGLMATHIVAVGAVPTSGAIEAQSHGQTVAGPDTGQEAPHLPEP